MVIENLLANLTGITNVLPPHIANMIETSMVILKTIGIAFLVYVIYIFIRIIMDFKRNKRIKLIEKKVNIIDKKLDILLKKKKKGKKN